MGSDRLKMAPTAEQKAIAAVAAEEREAMAAAAAGLDDLGVPPELSNRAISPRLMARFLELDAEDEPP